MARFIILFALFSCAAFAGEQRFASINLCTDQLLLDLAEPSQIVGLSLYAQDATRSWAYKKANGLPLLSGFAEDTLMARPTLVFAGSFTKRATRDMLKQQGVKVEEFAPARSVQDVKTQIRRMALSVGQSEKGEARIEEIEAALAQAQKLTLKRPLTAMIVHRRGYVSGTQSLIASLLSETGIRVLGDKNGRILRLEELLSLKADLLLLASSTQNPADQGEALLAHPALSALYPPGSRIFIAENLSICGGPMLKEALDSLVSQLKSLP